MASRKFLPPILVCLIVIDLGLALVGFFFPGFWFLVQHGNRYFNHDAHTLLLLCTFFWGIYALLQLVGLFCWKKNTSWLRVFIVIRVIDIFLIGFYIYSDPFLLVSAKVILYSAVPANFFLAWFFGSVWNPPAHI